MERWRRDAVVKALKHGGMELWSPGGALPAFGCGSMKLRSSMCAAGVATWMHRGREEQRSEARCSRGSLRYRDMERLSRSARVQTSRHGTLELCRRSDVEVRDKEVWSCAVGAGTWSIEVWGSGALEARSRCSDREVLRY